MSELNKERSLIRLVLAMIMPVIDKQLLVEMPQLFILCSCPI